MANVLPLRYDTADDVRARLNNTVAFYKKRPCCLVSEEGPRGHGNLEVVANDLINGDLFRHIHSSDDELDLQAKPLGYVNLEDKQVWYAMRAPARKPIQCIHPNTLVWFDLEGQQRASHHEYRTSPFGKMLLNDYPSFDEALSNLELGYTQAVAFSRKLAMRQSGRLIKLIYFNTCVGVLNRTTRSFAIPERLSHYVPLLKQQKVDCFSASAGG